MSAFFELRIYQIFPGKMDEWLSFMEKTIMPFQVEQGMVIHGSFVMNSSDQFALENGERVMNSEKKGNTYVWIRRFESQEEKNQFSLKKTLELQDRIDLLECKIENNETIYSFFNRLLMVLCVVNLLVTIFTKFL